MSLKLRILITAVVAIWATITADAAVAKNHSVDLVVAKYAQVADGFVSVDIRVTNNGVEPANCSLYVLEIGFTIPIATIHPGQEAGGVLTTPAAGLKRLTFFLNCDGRIVEKESVKVRSGD